MFPTDYRFIILHIFQICKHILTLFINFGVPHNKEMAFLVSFSGWNPWNRLACFQFVTFSVSIL